MTRRDSASAPNIRDVAAAAGVSYQTVSRVLNGATSVSPATRERVLETMAALDYRPSRAARALNLGRRGAVTVIAHDTRLYGYAGVLRGIEQSARAAGHVLSIAIVESASPEHTRLVAEHVSDPSAGAVVVIGFDEPARAALAQLPDQVPAVAVVDPGYRELGRPSLWLEERPAAEAATRLLLDLGHRTVHHVAIPELQRMTGREAGWRDALTHAGLPIPDPIRTGWRIEDGYRAGRELARRDDVTAVFCGNDELAMGVRRAMHDAGRAVPSDVSIVGFDDVPEAAFGVPSLTTVRMDFEALGRAAHALASSLVTGDDAPVPTLPAPRLVERESTAIASM